MQPNNVFINPYPDKTVENFVIEDDFTADYPSTDIMADIMAITINTNEIIQDSDEWLGEPVIMNSPKPILSFSPSPLPSLNLTPASKIELPAHDIFEWLKQAFSSSNIFIFFLVLINMEIAIFFAIKIIYRS